MATDLYLALQAFFSRYSQLQPRPFLISGESYAGKYVRPAVQAPAAAVPGPSEPECARMITGALHR